jgi:hypothetical protein
LEDAVLEGEVRIPGVSNYGEKHVSWKLCSFMSLPHPKKKRGGEAERARSDHHNATTSTTTTTTTTN